MLCCKTKLHKSKVYFLLHKQVKISGISQLDFVDRKLISGILVYGTFEINYPCQPCMVYFKIGKNVVFMSYVPWNLFLEQMMICTVVYDCLVCFLLEYLIKTLQLYNHTKSFITKFLSNSEKVIVSYIYILVDQPLVFSKVASYDPK